MSSPGARQRRRRQQYQSPRTRRELAAAVLAVLVIVGSTVLLIWMLRPGGIIDRQPRAAWLFGLAFGAAAIACAVILRPKSKLKVDRRVALASALGVIAVVTVVAGFLWPGGLLRHTPTFPVVPESPTTLATVAPGTTATPTSTPPTTAPTATTSP